MSQQEVTLAERRNSMNAQPKQEVIPATAQQAPAVSADLAFVQMVERLALADNVDVDKLDRMLAMKERVDARMAENAFNAAMAEAQKEMRAVAPDRDNSQTRSRYATYAALDHALRPTYTKHGFALSFDTGDAPAADVVRVLCYVTNAGFKRTYKVDMPADGKGAKGGDVMTKTHAAGAAFSYGARYLLKMIFNVAVGETDDDGNSASRGGATITEEQIETLRLAIMEADIPLAKFYKVMKVENLGELPANRFEEAKKQIEEVLAMRAAKRAKVEQPA